MNSDRSILEPVSLDLWPEGYRDWLSPCVQISEGEEICEESLCQNKNQESDAIVSAMFCPKLLDCFPAED